MDFGCEELSKDTAGVFFQKEFQYFCYVSSKCIIDLFLEKLAKLLEKGFNLYLDLARNKFFDFNFFYYLLCEGKIIRCDGCWGSSQTFSTLRATIRVFIWLFLWNTAAQFWFKFFTLRGYIFSVSVLEIILDMRSASLGGAILAITLIDFLLNPPLLHFCFAYYDFALPKNGIKSFLILYTENISCNHRVPKLGYRPTYRTYFD